MSKDEADCTADLKGLSDTQMETLCDWEVKFRQKYPVVGSVSPSSSQWLGMQPFCLPALPSSGLHAGSPLQAAHAQGAAAVRRQRPQAAHAAVHQGHRL